MGKIRERVPMLVSAGTLLTGAMLFGAVSAQLIDQTTTTVYATCAGLPCDAEDPDDCSSNCTCNDSAGCIAKN